MNFNNNNNYGNNGYGGYQDPNMNYQQGGYPQDPYQQPLQQMGSGTFKMSTERELYCKVEGNGMFFAKKGSMVGYTGDFKFSKRLLGTNGGNLVGQVMNHIGRKITGENLEIMEVKGAGTCYLADLAQHVTIIDLEPNGIWSHIVVESEDLLAFTPQCHYGVTPVGTGVLSQKGLFMSKLSYTGQGAQVAIKTNGNPMILTAPCRVDPDAVVAWTGANPHVKVDVGLKTLIGQTSGESYMFEFTQPGQMVIIQPYERESGVSLKDTTRPTTQSSPLANTRQNMQGMTSPNVGGNVGQGLGNILGNILG